MRLSHLSAAAVLVALVAALFVSLMPASAAPVVGDVTATFGVCSAGGGDIEGTTVEYGGDPVTGDAISVYVKDADSTDGETEDQANTDLQALVCEASAAGFNIRITPNGTEKPLIEVLTPTLEVKINDSDNLVKAGGEVTVTATLKNAPWATSVNLDWVRVSGVLDGNEDPESQTGGDSTDGNAANGEDVTIIVPKGTPIGEYVITAQTAAFNHDNNGNPDSPDRAIGGEVTMMVGDAGTNLSKASLSLGHSMLDDPATTASEATPQGDSVAATSADGINLVVSATNSLDKKSNKDDIVSITVIAPGGSIRLFNHKPPADHATTVHGARIPDTATTSDGDSFSHGSQATKLSLQSLIVNVTKSDRKPGTVDVYAILTGTDGASTTETLTLTFTGTQNSVDVADATKALVFISPSDDEDTEDKDEGAAEAIKLLVTAADVSGNSIPPATTGWALTITGPDGKAVSHTRISASQPTQNKADKQYYITIDGHGSEASPLATGEYTIKAKKGDLEDTASFTVSGGAANVGLEVDAETVAITDVITVTATVTDKDGNTIADAKDNITFSAAGALKLSGFGADDKGVVTKSTKDGVAMAQFVVTDGKGAAVILVRSSGATGTISVSSEAAAMAEPETLGLHCLSSNQGFATYSCGIDASASEIFGLVSGRGATAVHLWNGSAWVRYSVVDGTEVPGSSDFMVAENDILYISN